MAPSYTPTNKLNAFEYTFEIRNRFKLIYIHTCLVFGVKLHCSRNKTVYCMYKLFEVRRLITARHKKTKKRNRS